MVQKTFYKYNAGSNNNLQFFIKSTLLTALLRKFNCGNSSKLNSLSLRPIYKNYFFLITLTSHILL